MAQWNRKTSLVRDALVQEKWECYRESRAVGRRGRGLERVWGTAACRRLSEGTSTWLWGRGPFQCLAYIELLLLMHLLGWDQAFCNPKWLLAGSGV